MKSFECRATRREIDELEFGAGPGPRAQEHLATCKSCRQFRAERTELRELVRSLEPVVAPADFEMRVRARIAADRSSSRQQPFFARLVTTPALAVAALFVLAAGSVLWLAQRQPSSTVATTNSGASPKSNSSTAPASQPTASSVTNAEPSSDVVAQAGRAVPIQKVRAGARSVRSQDFAVLPANSIRQSDANQAYVNAPSKPVVFSLEDERGTTRKISLPAVTFGAQNLVDGRIPASYSGSSRVW